MNTRTLAAIAALSSLSLLGLAHAAGNQEDGNNPSDPISSSSSTLTRSQVQDQVMQAQRDGSMNQNAQTFYLRPTAAANTERSRAEVRDELLQAVKSGTIHLAGLAQ